MNKTALSVVCVLLFCGCTGINLGMFMGVDVELTHELLPGGSSKVEVKYVDIDKALNLSSMIEEIMGDMEEYKARVKEEFAEGLTEQDWQSKISDLVDRGVDPQDPRLAYPGPNPTDAELDPFMDLATEFAEKEFDTFLKDELICSNVGYISGMSLRHQTCKFVGNDLFITGTYATSEYFKKDYSTFPYVTYTYDFRGSSIMMNSYLSTYSEPFFEFFSKIRESSRAAKEIQELRETGNLTKTDYVQLAKEFEESRKNITSLRDELVTHMNETLPDNYSLTYYLKMPGEITNTGIGTIENNTVKTDFRNIIFNLDLLGLEPVTATSRELHPFVLPALLGIVLIGVLSYFLKKKKGKKAKALRKFLKKNKLKLGIVFGLIIASGIIYPMITPSINDAITDFELALYLQSEIDCKVAARLNTGMLGDKGTVYCSDEGLSNPLNITYVIVPENENESGLSVNTPTGAGFYIIDTIIVEEGKEITGTVYYVPKS